MDDLWYQSGYVGSDRDIHGRIRVLQDFLLSDINDNANGKLSVLDTNKPEVPASIFYAAIPLIDYGKKYLKFNKDYRGPVPFDGLWLEEYKQVTEIRVAAGQPHPVPLTLYTYYRANRIGFKGDDYAVREYVVSGKDYILRNFIKLALDAARRIAEYNSRQRMDRTAILDKGSTDICRILTANN